MMAKDIEEYRTIHNMRGTKLYNFIPNTVRLFMRIKLYKEKTMLVPEKNIDTPKAIQNPGSLSKVVLSSSTKDMYI